MISCKKNYTLSLHMNNTNKLKTLVPNLSAHVDKLIASDLAKRSRT